MLFNSGVERFLLVFVVEEKEIIPQHVFYDTYKIGRGTVTNTGRYLEQLGVLVRVRCWSEYKQDKVLCYRLTDAGKKVVHCLARIYDVLGLKPAPLGDDLSES